MALQKPTLVIGHRNPDMDAIAAAVGYAWLLNTLGPDTYIAGRTGEINAQTAFALDRFAIPAPELVADIWARVGDLAQPIPPIHSGQTLHEAARAVATAQRPVPVLDAESKPIGLLSGGELFAALAGSLDASATLPDVLSGQVDALLTGGIVPTLAAADPIRDVLHGVLRAAQSDFVVIDPRGHYVGMVRKSELLTPPRRRLVLVDHNEPPQVVPGLEDAELVEVLDHHRLGNPPTATPIRFHVEPVGSTSTLVAERAFAEGITLPAGIAGLLLMGILSDTLIFRSPTTTPHEPKAAARLAVLAGLAPADQPDKIDEAIQEVGQALLAAGAGLGVRSAEELVGSDLKFYEVAGNTTEIAQVEVTNFDELPSRLAALQTALAAMREAHHLTLAMLVITDVAHSNSRILVAGSQRVIAALPYPPLSDGTLDAPGVVSRKKQLLPVVLEALAQG